MVRAGADTGHDGFHRDNVVGSEVHAGTGIGWNIVAKRGCDAHTGQPASDISQFAGAEERRLQPNHADLFRIHSTKRRCDNSHPAFPGLMPGH